jgi:hypothetical protein
VEEVKIIINSHYTQIIIFQIFERITIYLPNYFEITYHAIKKYIKLKYDITFSKNIEDAIKDLASTYVAYIQSNCS